MYSSQIHLYYVCFICTNSKLLRKNYFAFFVFCSPIKCVTYKTFDVITIFGTDCKNAFYLAHKKRQGEKGRPADLSVPIVSCCSWLLGVNVDRDTHIFDEHTITKFFLRIFLPPSLFEEIAFILLCFPLRVSAPHSQFFFFSLLLFCLLSLQSFFLTENNGATGFLLVHIVLPLRKVSLFLMSSASVALSLRLFTNDLLAFASLCLLLALPPFSLLFFFSLYKSLFSLRLKIKWWRRCSGVQSP